MGRSIFGWDYPPGAANDPRAPWNQEDGPCAVCGNDVDDCICPECPECGSHGDPDCYEKHGLTRSDAQIKSLAEREEQWAEDSAAQAAADEQMEREQQEYWAEEERLAGEQSL